MKQFSKVLIATSIIFTAARGYAGFDEFDCRSSSNFSTNTHLQCVSCGAQKYFANKAPGREVVPSEKWMALLGITAVQHYKLSNKGSNKIASDFTARENYQKTVISMMRNYGFCQKYVSKQRAGSRADSRESDIAPTDWQSHIYPALTGNTDLNGKNEKALGKYFGFRTPSWHEFGAWDAGKNMNYLMTNNPDPSDSSFRSEYPLYVDQPAAERRSSFKRRLANAFPSEYDVSGEKKNSIKRLIETGDKSNGLEECLREIQRVQNGQGDPLLNSFMSNPAENTAFCKSMASACEIEMDFCTGGHKASTTTPTPPVVQPEPLNPPPPPPRSGGRSGTGVR